MCCAVPTLIKDLGTVCPHFTALGDFLELFKLQRLSSIEDLIEYIQYDDVFRLCQHILGRHKLKGPMDQLDLVTC